MQHDSRLTHQHTQPLRQAFATVGHMHDIAVQEVLRSIDGAASTLEAVVRAAKGDDHGAAAAAEAVAWIHRALAVLNGLLYSSASGRAWLVAQRGTPLSCGLAPMLRLVALGAKHGEHLLPMATRAMAVFVITNLSIGRDRGLQDTVRDWCCHRRNAVLYVMLLNRSRECIVVAI